MRSINNMVVVESQEKQQLLNLTGTLKEAIHASGIRSGFVGVYSQHTTASVFVTESQAALLEDVVAFFGEVVKDGRPYKHNSPEFSDCDRQNATAHLRAMLLGQSVLVPIVDGMPVLGQFQSIMLAEFDGPRRRAVHVQVLGE
jgi:secondary thiamine-phosphate synthase enzyme